MESELNLNDLVQEAQYRWLKPAEVLLILQNHEKYQLMDAPPQKPTSGSLFLFNKRVTRFFRKDGHSWRKKKAGRTVREGHERLKVGNVEALNCYYAHGEHNPNFQRRSFWMLDPAYEHIVLVQYREITEGKQSAGSVYLSPDCSSALSTSIYTAENQGSISAISEPYQNSSFSPVSMEFSPELLGGNNVVNYMGDIDRTDLTISSTANVSQALGRIEAQLSLKGDELLEVFPYSEENKRPKDSEGESYTRISNQDELLALEASDVRQSQQFSGGNAGFSNHTNSSIRLPHPGGCTIESKEVPCWKPLSEQSSGSCWIDPQDEIFNTLDQIVKPLSFSDMRDISANLAEQQENWTSPWQVPSELENNTKYPNNFFTTVQNSIAPQLSEAKQFQSGSDNMLSPNGISLLQEVEHSNVSTHPSGTGTHEAVNNCYVGRINQVEASLGADSRFTLAHKLRFKIQEISPGWGYATEETKVIIVGSFLCNPSDCRWSCMFGEVEVPLQIIQEGVLCCQAPPHVPGKVALCITSSDRELCSEVREFEYRSKPIICDNSSSLPKDTSTYTELLLLVRLVQMLLCEPLVSKNNTSKSVNIPGRPKEDTDRWEHIIETLLIGTDDQLSTKDWLLQELLRDKLQRWFSTKYNDGDTSDCNLTKKEQGIIHLVAGLGFEWALDPILKCGVGVNYRDINGWTALHWAAHFGREKMVAALIAAGASAGAVTDPTSQDPVGKTAGSIAAAKGHRGIAAYLSEKELTSQLSSLALDESETSNGTLGVEVDKTVESVPKECLNSIDNQHLLKESLAAVRNSAEAAARIQSFFRALSYKRRQQKEAAAACCDEYGITPDELSAASKLAFNRFHDHMLNKAAMSIQKKYRGRKARQEFLGLRQKIVMIQAHVRGYQVRKRYKVILWAVGILDKVILRWYRKRVGLRGFQSDLASVDESEYEEILKVFRKLKVDHAIDEALSRVLSMVESPEARQQYRRILENYWQAKADLCENASEAPSTSHDVGDNR